MISTTGWRHCAGSLLDVPEVFRHPQVVSRGLRIETDGVPMVANPMRIDGVRPVSRRAPPRLDEHGDAIRAGLADGSAWLQRALAAAGTGLES